MRATRVHSRPRLAVGVECALFRNGGVRIPRGVLDLVEEARTRSRRRLRSGLHGEGARGAIWRGQPTI